MSHLIIPTHWFSRPAAEIAPELLGCTLVRHFEDGQRIRGLIVETEAYAAGDPACHGYRKKTPRNASMFGSAGHLYVYLIYGMYYCLNIVTDHVDVPSAVLIRALALDQIPDWIPAKKRAQPHRIASGPGLLCQAMRIDRSHDGIPLIPQAHESIWVEFPDHQQPNSLESVQTTRIGLKQGTEIPWRWYLKDHRSVSRW